MLGKLRKGLFDLSLIGGSILTSIYIAKNTASFNITQGPSMSPTIEENSILFVDHLFYKIRGVRKGDVVIFRSFFDDSILCKRVTRVAGDQIEEGKPPVQEGWIFVEGDNKDQSFDSRMFGPIPKQLILGVALAEVYPQTKALTKTSS